MPDTLSIDDLKFGRRSRLATKRGEKLCEVRIPLQEGGWGSSEKVVVRREERKSEGDLVHAERLADRHHRGQRLSGKEEARSQLRSGWSCKESRTDLRVMACGELARKRERPDQHGEVGSLARVVGSVVKDLISCVAGRAPPAE